MLDLHAVDTVDEDLQWSSCKFHFRAEGANCVATTIHGHAFSQRETPIEPVLRAMPKNQPGIHHQHSHVSKDAVNRWTMWILLLVHTPLF